MKGSMKMKLLNKKQNKLLNILKKKVNNNGFRDLLSVF